MKEKLEFDCDQSKNLLICAVWTVSQFTQLWMEVSVSFFWVLLIIGCSHKLLFGSCFEKVGSWTSHSKRTRFRCSRRGSRVSWFARTTSSKPKGKFDFRNRLLIFLSICVCVSEQLFPFSKSNSTLLFERSAEKSSWRTRARDCQNTSIAVGNSATQGKSLNLIVLVILVVTFFLFFRSDRRHLLQCWVLCFFLFLVFDVVNIE